MSASKVFVSALLFLFSLTAAPALAADSVYYLFRHAEKTTESHDPGLTPEGMTRARYLADFFRDKGITRIFSSDYERTRETVAPLSDATGVPIEIYDPRDLEGFALALRDMAGVIIIVGHSNTTPELTALLTRRETEPMDESEYDRLYQVLVSEDGSYTINVLKQK